MTVKVLDYKGQALVGLFSLLERIIKIKQYNSNTYIANNIFFSVKPIFTLSYKHKVHYLFFKVANYLNGINMSYLKVSINRIGMHTVIFYMYSHRHIEKQYTFYNIMAGPLELNYQINEYIK